MSALDGPAPLLDVADLRVSYRSGRHLIEAVRGVSLRLRAGECLALVGESGSGKSTIARALLGLAGDGAQVSARRLGILGRDAADFGERDWLGLRGSVLGLVLQDALTALDPLRRVGSEVGEGLRVHRIVPPQQIPARVVELLTRVHVPEPGLRARQHPHQLSGGQRQRALIAAALAAEPRVLIADEPTASLDVTVQARILDVLGELKADGTALLVISHDLAAVSRLADRVAVLRGGEIVEEGPIAAVLGAPQHPYTKELVEAASRIGRPAATASASTSVVQAPDALDAPPILSGERLAKRFRRPDGTFHEAVADVSIHVAAGETVGIAGESGSGKTTLARLLLGLLRPDAGSVAVDGRAWSALPERERRKLRSGIQAVPQDPLSSFDPRLTTGRILTEALAVAGTARRDRRDAAVALLEQVGLTAGQLARHPLELSGGQRQRVAVARALAPRPRLLVCDEPVSALDVTVRAQVLDLLARLRRELGLAMVFVSHDLGVIRAVSDRVLIMRDGRVVEEGPAERVLRHPEHPATRALVEAVPRLDRFQSR